MVQIIIIKNEMYPREVRYVESLNYGLPIVGGNDYGIDDGYAVGYNTTCKIRAKLVEGNWDNSEYMTAYNQGYAEGSADCRRNNP